MPTGCATSPGAALNLQGKRIDVTLDALVSLWSSAGQLVIVVGETWLVQAVTPEAKRLLNLPDDCENAALVDLLPPLYDAAVKLATKHSSRQECQISLSDISFKVTLSILRSEDGQFSGCIIALENLAYLRWQTDQAYRARLLITMSEVDNLVLQCRDRHKLFDECCRILTVHGGYRMVWIGMADKESGRIVPVARSGLGTDYLDHVEIRFDDSVQGRGPSGMAVRTGKPQVNNDTEHNRSYSPWRSAATAQGFQSSAAFPLFAQDEVVGAINVYAAESAVFDQNELFLLQRVSETLGFALTNLQEVAMREQAEKALLQAHAEMEQRVVQRTRELAQSEARMRAQFTSMPIPTYIWCKSGEDFILESLNDAAQNYTRGGGRHFLGVRLRDLYCDRPDIVEDIERCFVQRISVQREMHYLSTSRSEETYLSVKYAYIPDRWVIVHTEDVSEQRNVLVSLTQSEQRFRSVLSNAPVVFFTIDRSGVVTLVEGQGLQNMHTSPEDYQGKHYLEVDTGGREFVENIEKALAGEVRRFDVQRRRFCLEVTLTPIYTDDGMVDGLIGVSSDVTARAHAQRFAERRADEEHVLTRLLLLAMEQQDKQRYIFNTMEFLLHEASWFSATQRLQVYLRKMSGSLDTLVPVFSYDREGFAGKQSPAVDMFGSPCCIDGVEVCDYDANIDTLLRRQFSLENSDDKEQALDFCLPITYGGKEQGLIRIELAADHGLDEQQAFLFKQVADIVSLGIARHVAIEQMLSARQVADAANRAKSDFLAQMSHELRTPMNAILGFTGLLLEFSSRDLNEFQLDALQRIQKAGSHLLGLINEILDLARVDVGQVQLEMEAVNLSDEIRSVVEFIAPLAWQKSIEVRSDGEFDFHVRADRGRLRQVLINLLSNAVKYNKAGGEVVISAGPTDNDKIRITIRDSGRGIQAEQLQRIFEPFTRLGNIGDGAEGTGIGLSISRTLVELMGGEIGVDSELGAGSVFWFNLIQEKNIPRPETLVENIRKAVANSVRQTTGSLLYVEDNPDNMELVRLIIQSLFDMEFLTAGTAQAGIELACSKRPDLILMDINLPDMSGYDALARLRALPETKGIPVVAVSAYAMKHQIEAGLQAGFVEYIAKPFDIDTFAKTLHKILGERVVAISES